MIIVSYVVLCPIVLIFFDDRDWRRGVIKRMKNVYLLIFLAELVLFPIIFGQVKELLMLKLRKIK